MEKEDENDSKGFKQLSDTGRTDGKGAWLKGNRSGAQKDRSQDISPLK